MPCRFLLACFERAMPIIVASMAAQTTAIAMTGFIKLMCDIPPPMSYMRRSRNSSEPAKSPAGATAL
jgi:hypothetical protein